MQHSGKLAPISQQNLLRNFERLRRILEATKLLNSTLDLSELTRIILRVVREEVGVDRGTVFVVDREAGQLRSVVAQDVENEIVVPIGKGIAGSVAETGEKIDIPDAYADPRFDQRFDALLAFRTRDIFCMPIVNRDNAIVGVLELLNRGKPFDDDDLEFLADVSIHIGLALENAWMHRQILTKRKIEQELDLAREIQQNFYPNVPPACGGVQIAVSSEMCEAVGGDYVDFYALENGRFIMMLGDVSGKGIGAALVMTSLNATCRALTRHIHSLEKVAMILNQTIVETTGPGTFVTLMIVLVDPVMRRLHYVCAGHNPPLHVDCTGHYTYVDKGGGPPIGLFPDWKYTREIIDVDPHSTVVIYTDGVSEAQDVREDQFGLDRLSAAVVGNRDQSAAEIHEKIRAALSDFVGARSASDDSTMIVLKF